MVKVKKHVIHSWCVLYVTGASSLDTNRISHPHPACQQTWGSWSGDRGHEDRVWRGGACCLLVLCPDRLYLNAGCRRMMHFYIKVIQPTLPKGLEWLFVDPTGYSTFPDLESYNDMLCCPPTTIWKSHCV